MENSTTRAEQLRTDGPEGRNYMRGFLPYALAAFLVGIVGGFTTVLGPAFVKDLGIAYTNTTWTALAMAMSSAACAPILGKLGDAIGRRTTLLLGIAVFTVGNILTAIAPSLGFMIAARFIVGVGTAAIAPVVLSYIVTEFPRQAMAKGFSLYMLISSGAVVFGPSLGGLLISLWGWRIMMWLCAGISVAIFFACLLIQRGRDTVAHQTEKLETRGFEGFDWAGAAWVLVFFSLLLCVPSFGQNFGWTSSSFRSILVAALLALAGLVLTERKADNPVLPANFMKRKVFILSVLALFLTQGLMQANMTNLIVFVNYTQPDNTLISSYAISIMYLGMSIGAVIAGPLADRHEAKYLLTGSLALTGIGCSLMLLFTAQTSALVMAGSLGILGLGLGGNGTILLKVVLSNLPEGTAGAGPGTYGLFRDLAAPFGVAVFVPMFTNQVVREMAADQAAGMQAATAAAEAAVSAIGSLAVAELLCVAAGIAVVLLLPRIHNIKKGTQTAVPS